MLSTAASATGAELLDAAPMGGWVYKSTQNSDLFVHRWIEVYRQGMLRTYHDFEADKKNCKSWYFDQKCELVPKTAQEIDNAESKLVRGRGTWTITATVRGQGQPVTLYLFTILWPSRWAPKGYSSLTIGHEDLDTVRAWHQLAEQSIAYMRKKYQDRKQARLAPGSSLAGTWSSAVAQINKTSMDLSDEASGAEGGAPRDTLASSSVTPKPVLRIMPGRKSASHTPSGSIGGGMILPMSSAPSASAVPNPSTLSRPQSGGAGRGPSSAQAVVADTSGPLPNALDSFSPTPLDGTPHVGSLAEVENPFLMTPPLPRGPGLGASQPALVERPKVKVSVSAARLGAQPPADHADSSDEEEAGGAGASRAQGGRRHWWGDISERWVPYKQTNGVAIYHLDEPNSGTGPLSLGGEYMVSAGVRGSPADVLDVLMHGSSHTTILGPASQVELLECTRRDDSTREVMRIVLEAPGWAGWLCAPREVLVERMLKTEEGMHVVLFSSVEPGSVEGLQCSKCATPGGQEQQQQQQQFHPQHQQQTRQRPLRSMYSRPVRGEVRGTYAIAPLEGHRLETSPETLITCILKVDLRGVCGDRSWLRPMADGLGWTDAFLDRILMSVILVRDQVEHSRFALKPLTLLARSTGAPSAISRHGSRVKAGEASMASQAAARAAGGEPSPTHSFTSAISGIASNNASASGAGLLAVPGATGVSESGSPPVIARRSMGLMHSRLSKSEHHGLHALDRASAGHPRKMASGLGKDDVRPSAAFDTIASERNTWQSAAGRSADDSWDEPTVGLDLGAIRKLATLGQNFWEDIHAPGKDCPFVVRGPTYLKDRKKIPAGLTAFTLAAMDVVTMPHPVEHVSRFLPCVRQGRAPFAFVINLIIPGTPLLGIVATFITDRHPDIMGTPPHDPMDDDHGWDPFDFVLHKFLHGDNATRNLMLKLIPHIADGSWVIKQSVGTTPVITGKALKTTYHVTESYIEISIDVSANNVAAYVTGLVRGATKNLVIDMGFVLEGTKPWELPECLLGALRLNYLDLKYAVPLDISQEVPLLRAVAMPEGTLHKRTRSSASNGVLKI